MSTSLATGVSLTKTQTIEIDSQNSAAILANDSNSFYVAYLDDHGQIKVLPYQKSGTSFVAGTPLPDPGKASMSPALVNMGGEIYLFYREYLSHSSGDDKDMYYQRFDNTTRTWTDPVNIHHQGVKGSTDHNPVVCYFNNQIWLIDKNNSHHFIAEAWMDASGTWHTNNNITNWDSDHGDKEDWGYIISPKDNGSTHQDNQILTEGNCNPCTPRNPSMTIFKGKIYVAYKGGRTSGDTSDELLYLMTANANHQWTDPQPFLNGATSMYAPALGVCGNNLICVFSQGGSGNSDHLHYCVSQDGVNWSDPTSLTSDDLENGKATDPFIMGLDANTLAVAYVMHHGNAKIKIYALN